MNKKLITQMWNERRSNIALFLELWLISVLLWWVVDIFYARLNVYFQPLGYDISHTYLVTLDRFPDTHPEYNPLYDEKEPESMFRILERIRRRPDVEVACMDLYSHPYSMRRDSQRFWYDTLSQYTHARKYVVGPGFFRVFRIQGVQGETPDELEERFKEEGVMVSNLFLQNLGVPSEELPGKCLHYYRDSARCREILLLLKHIREDEYDGDYLSQGLILEGFPDSSVTIRHTICVRMKAGQDENFIAHFWEDAEKEYRAGNVYVRTIESFSSFRDMSFSLRYYGAYNTQYYCLLLFLLLNVFLALLGTFWFRTRQRRQEIAIQMAMGSSRRQVFVRLISEALLLLLFATLPAMLIDYLWVHAKAITSYYGGFVAFPRTVSRYFIAVGVAFLIIAGTIVLGILYPAYKATKIPPADALQEE